MPKSTARPPFEEKAWCPTCDGMRRVVDRFEDVRYVPAGQIGVRVVALACGHSTSADDGTFYPIP